MSNNEHSNHYKLLVNKKISLNEDWSTLYEGRTFFRSIKLYVKNVQGPSWVMVKILNQDGAILESPTNGIAINSQGGPYIVSKANRYRVLIKAGIIGTYQLQLLKLK